eukprot:2634064-Ditylum_brightwellii.AAC.1
MVCAKKKKGRGPRPMVLKYGIEVPCNVAHALKIDKENGKTLWQDTIAIKIKTLDKMECFEFQDAGDIREGDYQLTTIHM